MNKQGVLSKFFKTSSALPSSASTSSSSLHPHPPPSSPERPLKKAKANPQEENEDKTSQQSSPNKEEQQEKAETTWKVIFFKANPPKEKVPERENLVIEPGIVLMKRFLSLEEQQAIADVCMEKGKDEKSGFYKPKVLVWNKLCQMKINQMCMGLHWNAQLHKYESTRTDHNSEPVHPLPDLLKETCDKVLLASQKLDDTHLPPSSPNSCIVNFYEAGSTLGFHRDASESKKSIKEGKPVISISIGSSADFQYYHGQDGRANKKTILLESGDALVFGGPARLMYHGVPKVHHEKFPPGLRMKQGRLNVTFREW